MKKAVDKSVNNNDILNGQHFKLKSVMIQFSCYNSNFAQFYFNYCLLLQLKLIIYSNKCCRYYILKDISECLPLSNLLSNFSK